MAKEKEKFGEEITAYFQLDRRGALLNAGLVLVTAVVSSLWAPTLLTQQRLFWPEWNGFSTGLIFLSSFILTFVLALKFRYSSGWTKALFVLFTLVIASVFAGAVGFFGAFFGALDGVSGGPSAFIGLALAAIVFAGAFASFLVGALTGADSNAFTFAFSSAYYFSLVVAIFFLVPSFNIIRFRLIEMYQRRANTVRQADTSIAVEWDESGKRSLVWQMLCALTSGRPTATIGLAGRRGTGKTAFLKRILYHVYPQAIPASVQYKDFKNPKFSPHKYRLHAIRLLVRSPVDFEEMGFLSALFEQLALRVDAALACLIPAVKPYAVTCELETKALHQRVLHRVYLLFYVLLLVPVVMLIFILSDRVPKHVVPAAVTQMTTDSLIASISTPKVKTVDSLNQRSSIKLDSLCTAAALANSALYHSYLDFLDRQTQGLRDSLHLIEKQWEMLLNPSQSTFLQLPYWYESGNRFTSYDSRRPNHSMVLDSLLKYTRKQYQPLLDSLDRQLRAGQVRLDSIAVQSLLHQQLENTLADYEKRLGQDSTFGKISIKELWLILGGLVLLPTVLWVLGREPGGSPYDHCYQRHLSNEIALYRLTQEILARLRFHHSFGEEQNVSLGWGSKWGFSVGLGKSKQVTRSQVPFTLLSLVEEYRNYVREVCHYLNQALAEDAEKESKKPSERSEEKAKVAENKVKIYIAIDELDKVLDLERLHQMLKSIKAIFDLDNVYYLLSISEDALGTYRLRNVETKNEVDSAFTHILLLPPMEAVASIEFFQQRDVRTEFIAPLVVYGAGVPRDMHRLADIALAKTTPSSESDSTIKKWENLSDCVHHFFGEDKQAIIDLISQQPGLSDIWKQKLLDLIEQDGLSTKFSVEKNLAGFLETHFHLEEFIKSNPGTEDENRRLFFKLHALVSGYFVKNHLHRELLGFEETWLKNTQDDFTLENLPQKIFEWLELRRAVAYDISSNPLGAWERLKKDG